MSVDRLKVVHEELKFDAYRDRLKALGGVWTQLQNMLGRARKDQAGLNLYKTFLARAIEAIDAEEADTLTSSEIDLACQRYVELYGSLSEQTRSTAQLRGGRTIEAWTEKWLPEEHRRYQSALDEVDTAGPTRGRFKKLMDATQQLFDAYASAMEGHRDRNRTL